jgi:hypothetical protein
LSYNITNGGGYIFTRDDMIDPFYICMKVENGMECKKLG